MDALLIREELVSQFSFWQQGKIEQGMRFRNELFQQVDRFPIADRPKAFEVAGCYARQHAQVVVTVARHHYVIWVNLRSNSTAEVAYSTAMLNPFPA